MSKQRYNKGPVLYLVSLSVFLVSVIAIFTIVHRIQTGESILPQISRASSQNIQRWFHPNYHNRFNHDLASASWGSYFTNSSQMENILNNINVFGLFLEQIESNKGYFLNNLVPRLKNKNIKISTEVVPTACDENNKIVDGKRWANYIMGTVLKPLTDAGGTIDYFSIDAFPASLLSRTSTPKCFKNIDEMLPELIRFMKTVHANAAYKSARFGLNINLPNYGYGNSISYWTNNEPWGDFKSHMEKIIAAVNNAGEKLYYVNVDNPYDYAIGAYPHTIQGVDWMQRIRDVEKQTRAHGLRFGLMLNSERGGWGYDKKSGSDKQLYDDTMAFVRAYYERGGRLDNVIVESWHTHPSALFPDSTPYTMTYNALQAYGLYDSLIGVQPIGDVKTVYQLKNAAGITFLVMNETEQKNAIEKYGYKSPTPLFKAWVSKKDANLLPVYRLQKSNAGYLYTLWEQEKNNAINAYGYSLNGVAFYAYSQKTAATVPVYRLQSTKSGVGSTFLYTLSESEKTTAINSGKYTLNGVAFYVLPP